MGQPLSIPNLIICRDRLTAPQALVGWLEAAGQERIILVDVQSTYEPLLEWLATTPHTVERIDENLGHQSPWLAGVVDRHGGDRSPYMVSDCDILPDEDCPVDAVEHCRDQLLGHPELVKVGLSLRIDDIADDYPQAAAVRQWERQFTEHSLSPELWAADVDTSFAVYRPGVPFSTRPAARTKPPYQARHLPWYMSAGRLAPDEAYYEEHARLGYTTWNHRKLPAWLRRNLAGKEPRNVGRTEQKVRHVLRTRRWR